MDKNKTKQMGVSIGVGNSINQNIIQINSNDSKLQSCNLTNDYQKSPRKRMQLEHDIELPEGLIDIPKIKKQAQMAKRWIQSAQNAIDFGLPTDDIGSESCSWASSGLLWSSWVIDGQTPDWWIKCLRWVHSQTNADNGIPIVRRNDSSITDATAFALMCSSVAGEQFRNTADNLCDWILDMQNMGGWKWGQQAKNYNFISSGLALLSLKVYYNITGAKASQIGSAIESGVKFLIDKRNFDSGWGGFPGDNSRPANTGYIMYVLSALGQENQASEAIEYLELVYRNFIGWYNSTDRPASHNVTRLGVPYALMGLSSLRQSNNRDTLLKSGFDILISGFKNGVYEIPETIARSWPTRDFIFACSTIISD